MAILTHDEITRLSAPERLALIGELWDSIADEDLPVTSAQSRELMRRMATFDQDRTQAISWDELKADLAARAP